MFARLFSALTGASNPPVVSSAAAAAVLPDIRPNPLLTAVNEQIQRIASESGVIISYGDKCNTDETNQVIELAEKILGERLNDLADLFRCCRQWDASRPWHFLVLKNNQDKLIGFAFLTTYNAAAFNSILGKTAESKLESILDWVVVDNAHRRKGYGTLLLAESFNWFRKVNSACDTVTFDIPDTSHDSSLREGAAKFHEAHGAVKNEKKYWADSYLYHVNDRSAEELLIQKGLLNAPPSHRQ